MSPVVENSLDNFVHCIVMYLAVILIIICLFLQAQQLFQKDAQTITPEALESVKAALASSDIEHKAETKKKAIPRKAAGQTWEDPTLAEWPESMLTFLSHIVVLYLYFYVYRLALPTYKNFDLFPSTGMWVFIRSLYSS